MAENRDLAALREEVRAPREDVETRTALGLVAGLDSIETLAVPGRFTARRRPAARGQRR